MKNRRLRASISRTINLGNYESIRIQADLEFDISDTDNITNAFRNGFNLVTDEVLSRCPETHHQHVPPHRRGKMDKNKGGKLPPARVKEEKIDIEQDQKSAKFKLGKLSKRKVDI